MKNIVPVILLLHFCLGGTFASAQDNAQDNLKTLKNLELDDLSDSDVIVLENSLQINHYKLSSSDRIKYYTALASAYEEDGNNLMAVVATDSLISSLKKQKDKSILADAFVKKSSIHDNLGEYPEALVASLRALELYKELGDRSGESTCYNDLGVLHYYRGSDSIARTYFNEAYKICKELNDSTGLAQFYNNMANTMFESEDYKDALAMYQKGLAIDRLLGDLDGESISLSNIGEVYILMEDFDKAEATLLESLRIAEEIDDPWTISNPLRGLGQLYQAQGKLDKAIEVTQRSIELSLQINTLPELSAAYKLLYSLHKEKGDLNLAIKYLELHKYADDSIFDQNKERMIGEIEIQRQMEDKAHTVKLTEIKHKQEIDAQNSRTTILILSLVGFFILLMLAIRGILLKRKANKRLSSQNEVIQDKNERLELANSEIEKKNSEILDSIRYAKRIQNAILPTDEMLNHHLENSFVLYKPKDIVAGDFYWLENKNDKILIAVADCTGHGVPGAMVSVVCNNGLNRSVREHNLIDPGKILDKTREIIVQEFEKSEDHVQDGMDIALCALSTKASDQASVSLEYAGANQPLWIIRDGELIEIKASKQPIGMYDNHSPYQTHQLELQAGDTFYIFSDGYVDQFGGERDKKFKAKAFKELLLEIQKHSMQEQKDLIDEAFESWKGSTDQVDDVCVVGVRV